MKTRKIAKPYIDGFFLSILRVKLTYKEKKRSKAIESTLEATVDNFKKINKTDFEALKVIFNISLFFLLAERDIQAVKVDALTHPDPWKRNLSLRVMLLVMHEWNMAKVAPANKLQEAFDNAGINESLRKEMTLSLRLVNKAQSKAKKALSNARHSTIAHRDSDAMYQYETIQNLDTSETMKIMVSFYEAADLFIKTLPKVMIEASGFNSLLNQYSKNA